MIIRSIRFFVATFLFIAGLDVSIAQDAPSDHSAPDTGKVHVDVSPEEAYIWVDGKPVVHRSSYLNLTPGEHKIAVYNYGYKPEVRTINVIAGESSSTELYCPASSKWVLHIFAGHCDWLANKHSQCGCGETNPLWGSPTSA